MEASPITPNPWLRQLARSKPAQWNWGRAIRGAICVPLPLAIGFLTDNIGLGVWMSIATLGLVPAEGNGSYRSRFRMVAIVALIGSLGCLAGYLAALPWALVVVCMALLSFVACVVSSYGAPYSLGTLQTLVLASIALGLPQIAPFWEPSLYYLAGAVFYAIVLAIEALLLRSRPQRDMIVSLIQALAQLARSREKVLQQTATQTEESAFEECRRVVTEHIADFYAMTFEKRSRNGGRTDDIDMCWALLRGCSTAFASIVSHTDKDALEANAMALEKIAARVRDGARKMPQGIAPEGQDALSAAVRAIAIAGITSHSPFSPVITASFGKADASDKMNWSIVRDRLIPGKRTVRTALALALCVGVSYAAHWFDNSSRWYWIPLTVALIMKPDFGSIFARSLLRSIGTLIGVIIGSLIMIYLPKDMVLIPIMAVFAALLPWANQRSYAMLALVISPVVLVLVDLSVPGPENINYAAQRFIGTFIGAVIVLIFGYFLWPRSRMREFSERFHAAAGAIGAYLKVVSDTAHSSGDVLAASEVSRARRIAYSSLKDIRVQLQQAMAEPPPAGTEAAAWQPLVASAERICDHITSHSVEVDGAVEPSDPALNARLAEAIAQMPDTPVQPPALTATNASAAQTRLNARIQEELAFIGHATHGSIQPDSRPQTQPTGCINSA